MSPPPPPGLGVLTLGPHPLTGGAHSLRRGACSRARHRPVRADDVVPVAVRDCHGAPGWSCCAGPACAAWGWTVPSALITQRSRVQIPPPLLESSGQGPDRQEAIRPLIFMAAWRQQDQAAQAAGSCHKSDLIGIPKRVCSRDRRLTSAGRTLTSWIRYAATRARYGLPRYRNTASDTCAALAQRRGHRHRRPGRCRWARPGSRICLPCCSPCRGPVWGIEAR
jgi:hypothetical protein